MRDQKMVIDWNYCQVNSNSIPADGILELLESEQDINLEFPQSYGVYLFSAQQKHYYIGQAKNLRARLKQQYSSRSTFYNNYLKEFGSSKNHLQQLDFDLLYFHGHWAKRTGRIWHGQFANQSK